MGEVLIKTIVWRTCTTIGRGVGGGKGEGGGRGWGRLKGLLRLGGFGSVELRQQEQRVVVTDVFQKDNNININNSNNNNNSHNGKTPTAKAAAK